MANFDKRIRRTCQITIYNMISIKKLPTPKHRQEVSPTAEAPSGKLGPKSSALYQVGEAATYTVIVDINGLYNIDTVGLVLLVQLLLEKQQYADEQTCNKQPSTKCDATLKKYQVEERYMKRKTQITLTPDGSPSTVFLNAALFKQHEQS